MPVLFVGILQVTYYVCMHNFKQVQKWCRAPDFNEDFACALAVIETRQKTTLQMMLGLTAMVRWNAIDARKCSVARVFP